MKCHSLSWEPERNPLQIQASSDSQLFHSKPVESWLVWNSNVTFWPCLRPQSISNSLLFLSLILGMVSIPRKGSKVPGELARLCLKLRNTGWHFPKQNKTTSWRCCNLCPSFCLVLFLFLSFCEDLILNHLHNTPASTYLLYYVG